jgi:hypothetical protein
MHSWPEGQAFPQVPQLAESKLRSSQVEWQQVRSGPPSGVQRSPSFEAPQLLSTQTPEFWAQVVLEGQVPPPKGPQLREQPPKVQVAPEGQAWPQPPQLLASWLVSTQPLGQQAPAPPAGVWQFVPVGLVAQFTAAAQLPNWQ